MASLLSILGLVLQTLLSALLPLLSRPSVGEESKPSPTSYNEWLSTWKRMVGCVLLGSLLLQLLGGCTQHSFIVAKPESYGYVTERVEVKALWPDSTGKLIESSGTLPPGTVLLVPKDGGPTTRP